MGKFVAEQKLIAETIGALRVFDEMLSFDGGQGWTHVHSGDMVHFAARNAATLLATLVNQLDATDQIDAHDLAIEQRTPCGIADTAWIAGEDVAPNESPDPEDPF